LVAAREIWVGESWRQRIPEVLAILLAAQIVYLVTVYLVLRGPKDRMRNIPYRLLLAGVVFRATVLPVAPALSDDVYRYLWEGRLQQAGGNPYLERPDDPRWQALRDSTYARIPAPNFPGGYGPIWTLSERITSNLAGAVSGNPDQQAIAIKLLSCAADLATMLVLPGALTVWGLPAAWSIIYAWNPLVIAEFGWSGHNDSWAILALVLALRAAGQKRWGRSFSALSLGVAAKYWPLLLFPSTLERSPRRVLAALLVIPIVAICFLPFVADLTRTAQFMTGFVGGWRNNDAIYGATLWLAHDDVYLAKYLTFLWIAVLVAFIWWRRMPLYEAWLATLAGTLLLTSNIHPWYLTWFVPLLAFRPVPALLLWQALVPLAYQVRIDYELLGQWNGVVPERWLIHGPVLAWIVFSIWRTARRPAA
jgi:hypothetical protein